EATELLEAEVLRVDELPHARVAAQARFEAIDLEARGEHAVLRAVQVEVAALIELAERAAVDHRELRVDVARDHREVRPEIEVAGEHVLLEVAALYQRAIAVVLAPFASERDLERARAQIERERMRDGKTRDRLDLPGDRAAPR